MVDNMELAGCFGVLCLLGGIAFIIFACIIGQYMLAISVILFWFSFFGQDLIEKWFPNKPNIVRVLMWITFPNMVFWIVVASMHAPK